MVSGQGGYRLATHGGRVPIPWLIGTAGWAMFIHQPFGTFDFSGPQSRFVPGPEAKWPLDLFFVSSRDPATIMAEYSRLTGRAELPPLWSFGYQQSHRTLASREEVLSEAKTFREKKLPCDALIYLGTGFCPSGWNTQNGSFAWNSRVFPDPEKMIGQLHQDHFRWYSMPWFSPTNCEVGKRRVHVVALRRGRGGMLLGHTSQRFRHRGGWLVARRRRSDGHRLTAGSEPDVLGGSTD